MTEEVRRAVLGSGGAGFRRRELAAVIYHGLAQWLCRDGGRWRALTGKQYPEIHIVGGGANAQYLNRPTTECTRKDGCEAADGGETALGNLAVQMIAAENLKTSVQREHALRIRLQWRSLKERREKRDDRL